MMKPTIGRKVWYWPFPHERAFGTDQPFDATVCFVRGDRAIDVAINNEFGNAIHGRPCTLVAPGETAAPGECSWMPYQIGQAQQQTDSAVHVVGTGPIAGELAGG
jgi:hypothetical protein